MHQLDQMMLHEAVMLEIYRQALSARDTASPRCSSRNSSNGGGRCPSADSNYSDRQSSNAAGSTATSPLALPIPQMLPAAALLPSQSAAMAAYLGAAAVAAQQNRLLLGGHALGLGRDASPPFLPLQSPIGGDTPVLDFSTKRKSQDFDDMDREHHNKSNDDEDDSNMKSDNDPLDLSVSSRKRSNQSPPLPRPASHGRKVSRTMDYKSALGSPWSSPPIASYFAGTNTSTTSPSPKTHHLSHGPQHQAEWNGLKNKISTPNDATKALEKMSELSRLGGNEVGRQSNTGSSSSSNTPSTGRHSAWQSHWLNKGADSVKDVFKCVWCKQSFPTLETLTIHMKETQHLGVNMDGQRGHNHQAQPPHNSHPNQNHAAQNSSSSTSSAPSKADLHLMIKETMPLPRKLVRGQDVWLGKGAEQTRQILKCMWCGQSFRSLSEMTTHMQQTQHYTNIISQEQIISWKSSDDIKGGSSSGGNANNSSSNGSNVASGNISTVSAVLTCKVCDQAFSSLKDLSNHMVKNAHYKEHIMRSISESGGRRRQTREKRKKSLPVRKLLEIERAQNEYKNGDNSPITKSLRDAGSGRITCEKCGDKIDTSVFVEHIRQCIGATAAESNAQRNLLKNNILMPDSLPRDGRKSIGGDDSNASQSSRLMSPNLSSKEGSSTSDKTGSPSVLNAIEQMIEKSFDTRSRHVSSNFTANNQQNAPLGSSILKRLGIDESVDYTKPLIDTQTMNLLRGFSQQSASSTYSQRERSASESSSVSDRGSSVIETSMTPERKTDSVNGRPRDTPDKCSQYGDGQDENEAISLKIKTDPEYDDKAKTSSKDRGASSMSIKREMTDDENDPDDKSEHASDLRASALLSPALSSKRSNSGDEQRTPLASPNSDAISPRSTPDRNSKKSKSSIPTNSLGALSSMFDSLAGNASTKSVESGKKTNSNPLAALQKLCDKTENTPLKSSNNSQNQLAVPVQQNNSPSTASGAMLAFSWACNDGMVNAADSAIKCAFCDTPFSSKGAYRHHLSKVHFVKDDNLLDPIIAKAQKLSASRRTPPSQAHSPRSVSSSASSSGNGLPNNRLSKSPTPPATALNSHQSTSNASQSSASGANFDESPHSKFLKYTELAKQLSSKYV
ncbi:protein tiptop isoform X2 [Sitodiplosis mosellana]|uniref:protein tiptop isoform X2 n=1 Tax=Sitodiplosis mosellana TaxID=263140 RepID=UPI002444B15E|nr:protein tiptop isoform X2 [Sitodiplosis mosellana]